MVDRTSESKSPSLSLHFCGRIYQLPGKPNHEDKDWVRTMVLDILILFILRLFSLDSCLSFSFFGANLLKYTLTKLGVVWEKPDHLCKVWWGPCFILKS